METNYLNIFIYFIIGANALISYRGFENHSFFEKYLFKISSIKYDKEYIRILSSGFLHANWPHLIFNMLTFYFFSGIVGYALGVLYFLLIYFLSLIIGNIITLFIRKNQDNYRAVGASGAVSGIVFSSIIISPFSKLYILFLPIGIPAWLFGILFILYSVYGMRAQRDFIGHEAHFGGAVTGALLTVLINPQLLLSHF